MKDTATQYMKYLPAILGAVILLGLAAACGSHPEPRQRAPEDRFEVLISYMEENADYLNSPDTPFFINAPEVFQNMRSNFLVIDIRSPEEYEKGHIEGSVNILPADIIPFFENRIHVPAFDTIVLVCNAGYRSAYVAMAARYLGYENVFPLRNGLSSWDLSVAENYRLRYRSDQLVDRLETTDRPMNAPGEFPVIMSRKTGGYELLRERILDILGGDISERFITVEQWMEDPGSWYLMAYWPEAIYMRGHLPGAIRYQPRRSLRFGESLSTLPADQPVIVQCFAGNHSNFVTMYLNILGYDARSMVYGANSFMYSILEANDSPGVYFAAEKDVFHYPLVTPGGEADPAQVPVRPQVAIPDGGC